MALAIRAVTFDVGSTLLADPRSEERREESRALKHWLKDHGLVEKDERRRVLADSSRFWSDSGLESERVASEVADSIVTSLAVQVAASERQRLEALLSDIYRDGPYVAASGVRAALSGLRKHGVALGIVSNRGARPGRLMLRQLEVNGLAGFFDSRAVVWSDEVGVSKPDPRIFLACLDALGVAPERAAHVGDVKDKDVAGARELGMLTIRYTGIRDDHTDGPEADIVISAYDELEEALGLPAAAAARARRRLLATLPLALGPAAFESFEASGEVLERLGQLVAAARGIW